MAFLFTRSIFTYIIYRVPGRFPAFSPAARERDDGVHDDHGKDYCEYSVCRLDMSKTSPHSRYRLGHGMTNRLAWR